MLIEAAWSYEFPARMSHQQLLREQGLAKPISRMPRGRHRNDFAGGIIPDLHGRVKPPTVVTTAIARELAGFVWAIARQAQPTDA